MTLEYYNEYKVKDINGVNDMTMEVNWKEGSGNKIRIKLGKKIAVVNYRDLYNFIFLVANEEQQEAMMPIRQTTIRKFVRQHRVRIEKPLKIGEHVVINCEIDVPITQEEGLRSLLNKKNKVSNLIK